MREIVEFFLVNVGDGFLDLSLSVSLPLDDEEIADLLEGGDDDGGRYQ